MKKLSDYVMILDDVLSDELCNELIEKFDASLNVESTEATWHGSYQKRFDELNLTKEEEFQENCIELYTLSKNLVEFYKEKCEIEFFPTKIGYEELRLKKYSVNDTDKFDWHSDVGDYSSARRFLSMFFYLNDVEDGGQTVFNDSSFYPEKDLSINPRRGRIVVFPPMWMYPHKALPPISNSKYILSTYCHYT